LPRGQHQIWPKAQSGRPNLTKAASAINDKNLLDLAKAARLIFEPKADAQAFTLI